jgi:hypothetical protein
LLSTDIGGAEEVLVFTREEWGIFSSTAGWEVAEAEFGFIAPVTSNFRNKSGQPTAGFRFI